MRDLMRFPVIKWTGGAAGLALVVFLATLATSFRTEDVEAAAPPPTVSATALRLPELGAAAGVGEAVDRDLFSPDRKRPAKRYRPPGSAEAASPKSAPAKPVVLGTAIGADGEVFATCQAADGNSVIVRPGQKVGEYTVVSIIRGKVTFRGPGGEPLVIDANKPAP